MNEDLLKSIPSITQLLDHQVVAGWVERHPRGLVTDCIRQAVEQLRKQIRGDDGGRCAAVHAGADYILARAGEILDQRTQYRLRSAINATGIILHTGLGRSILPQGVAASMAGELSGYVTLAIDRQGGLRSDRDQRVEYILQELMGAQAATVVNNNAAATVLTLAALAAGRETIVSRGQLIEIGGAFRLPDVMASSGTRMVEIGTTNKTHLRDYESAITDQTAAILRVHPSNYRVVGFTSQPSLEELVELARRKGVPLIDDLGAGAMVDLRQFGLPREPLVKESIAAGADIVLFSADKLIGSAQGGIIIGRKQLVDRIRKHPLARAFRPDKMCLMAIERTLHLFRDPQRLAAEHPLYRMLSESPEMLQRRAEALAAQIVAAAPGIQAQVVESQAYLGSGSVPMEPLGSFAVALVASGSTPAALAARLRLDQSAVFGRIEDNRVLLDVRTIKDEHVAAIAQAVGRAMAT